jgi:hypothetical protein
MSFLTDKVSALNSACSIPADWVIVPDERTGNLLVHDGERGFAVSSVYLNDFPTDRIAADVNAAVADIHLNGWSEAAPVYSVTELIAQGN